jgi:hypothetical protein
MSEAFGITVFCDDIRREVDNKTSLIGVYGDELVLFTPPPIVLPKLGFHIDVRFPTDNIVDENVNLLVYFPGDAEDAPRINEVIPWKSGEPPTEPPPFPDAVPAFHFLQYHVLSPVEIHTEGFIRVRLLYSGHRIRVGALKVVYKPPGSEPNDAPA